MIEDAFQIIRKRTKEGQAPRRTCELRESAMRFERERERRGDSRRKTGKEEYRKEDSLWPFDDLERP